VEPVPATSPPHESPRPRRRRLLAAALGLLLGLGLTEAGFRHRDGGAFPLLNVYEADEARGVRLSPGARTVVGRRGERATTVRVNDEGYRGAAWPAPAPDQVVVVGDSLSFGLGVEEDEALPARLHAAIAGGPAVLDASVPTYGPPEYLATMRAILAARRPSRVVLVLNPMNDLAELDRPNRERHAALDGWAVRVHPGLGPRASSPLRAEVIRRSHAAFALWRWQRTQELSAAPLAPEDGLGALLDAAARAEAAERAEAAHASAVAGHEAEARAIAREAEEARAGVVAMVGRYRGLFASTLTAREEWDAYLAGDGEPAEAVVHYLGGCVAVRWNRETKVRLPGPRVREDVERMLRDVASVMRAESGGEIKAAFARRQAARARLGEPRPPLPAPPERAALPVDAFLAEAATLAKAHGAALTVVVAPLDAQLSEAARRRLGVPPAAAASIDALARAIVASARRAGAEGVDGTPALAPLGAAAFLADGHLSAAGHEALARAVAASLGK
jgi:hypothetical protein